VPLVDDHSEWLRSLTRRHDRTSAGSEPATLLNRGDEVSEHQSISVCIITGRRLDVLGECLASLRQQVDAPPFEVIVGSDGDPDVAAVVHAHFPDAAVCELGEAHPGGGRNVLVERARGDLLLFLDDDVTVRDDLLARLAALAEAHPEVGVFGGPNDSPAASSQFQFVQGAALASAVGSGPVRRRYGAHPAAGADERYFILCNLAVRREVMQPFSPDLICAEENHLLGALRRAGVAMYYDPELVCYHERRPTWRGFARQMHKYGRGRGQLTRVERTTLRPSFLVPSALLAYLAGLPALVLAYGPLVLAPLAVYVAAVAAGAVAIAFTRRRPTDLPLAALLLVTIHVAYGSGLVRGVARLPRPMPQPVALAWVAAPGAVEP
jgi:succinoglycan biosynthesis protein ExoA